MATKPETPADELDQDTAAKPLPGAQKDDAAGRAPDGDKKAERDAQPKPGPKPKPAPEPDPEADDDILGDIDEDEDEDEAPAPKRRRKPDDTDDKKSDAPSAPEKYDLKLPDGVPMDVADAQELLEKIATDAKARGLSQDQAHALVGERVEQEKARRALVTQWSEEIKADKKFGGAALPETTDNAKAALKRFFPGIDPVLLEKTGLGSHPEFVRGLARIGKAMKPDRHVKGGEPKAQPKTLSQKMYPDMYGPDGQPRRI